MTDTRRGVGPWPEGLTLSREEMQTSLLEKR